MKVRQPDQDYGFFGEKIPPRSTWGVGACLLGNVSSLLRGDQKTRLSSGFSQPKSIWKPCLRGLPSGTSWNRCYRRSGSERDQDFVLATHPGVSRHLPGRLRRCCVHCRHSVAQWNHLISPLLINIPVFTISNNKIKNILLFISVFEYL